MNPPNTQQTDPTSTPTNTCVVTLVTRDSPARQVAAPVDLPIEQLLPEFAAVSGATEAQTHELELVHPDGSRLPRQATLAECGVNDGTRLELRAREETTDTLRAIPPERRGSGQAAQRPVTERTARVLPSRLPAGQRLAATTSALWRRCAVAASRRVDPLATPDPRRFTRETPGSPLQRARATWRQTDYERQLDDLIVEPRLRRCVIIAVVSPKGGVGKSTVSALLGALLAYLRRDRTVGVDTNPDWGSLGRRLVSDHPVFIDDLLNGPLQIGELSVTHLDAQLGRGPNGLMIAPAPTDPQRSEQLDETAYRTLFQRLGGLVGTLVLDCGTGLNEPPARDARTCADQLVLVADSEPDTASLVAEAGTWLEHSGPPLTLLVNRMDRSSRLDVGELERAIPHARGIATLPTHPRGAAQLLHSQFSWAAAPRPWRIAIRELAALLASDWRRLGVSLETTQLP